MQFRPELTGVAESPMVRIATVAEGMPGSLKLCDGESDMPTPEFIGTAANKATVGASMAIYAAIRAFVGRGRCRLCS